MLGLHNCRGDVTMALPDEEQRQLAEIERRLAEEDPRLAQRLARLRPLALSSTAVAVFVALMCFVVGLIVVAVGTQLGSLPVGVVGAVVGVGVPTLVVWRLWLRRLR